MTPAVADRAAKLLRLACSTGPDGEKLAAIGRLSALVTAHDLDWDQLLAGNGHALTQEDMQRIYAEGYERGLREAAASKPSTSDWASAGRSRADEVGGRLEELKSILKAAAQSKADGALSGWFADFASDMQERVEQWGARTFVSEKQWECIEKLRSILERTDYL